MYTQLIPVRYSHFTSNYCYPRPSRKEEDSTLHFFGFHTQLRMIGSGQFARVYQSQDYAIKRIDQRQLTPRQINSIRHEEYILKNVQHPFLVRYFGACQTRHSVLLAMEYVPGGELFKHIHKNKKLSEKEARFFAAEIVLAIEYLHEKNIVYRDLKPENVMLDAEGHVKLIDFGFAKVLNEKTYTLCGTPDYLAPEVIKVRGYTKAVDWWALGVLIYEMLVGHAPFTSPNPLELYENILLCDIRDWSDMSSEAKDLLQGLLQTNPSERLDAQKIKSHPWFSLIDFDLLLEKKLRPPFREGE
ncbi:kinase-like domain-containing protein [Sporodiniella umbellata]|nr:kinase-like domain-containing protein [Sporodiniella umbellata]